MRTAERVQTAFRFDARLLERMKREAKKQNKTLNSFVEETMEEKVGRELEFPKLPKDFKASEEAKSFAIGGQLPERYRGLSAAEQADMDKEVLYEALMEKYGESIY